MKRCENCGKENPEQAQRCMNCAAPLPPVKEQTGINELPPGPMQVGPAETPDITPPPASPQSASLTEPEPTPTTAPEPALLPRSVEEPLPPPLPQPTPMPLPPPTVLPAPPTGSQPSQAAIWSLVLGIASLPCCGLFGLIFAIIAIVLGKQARNDPSSNQQTAKIGYIFGIIGVIANILALIAIAIAFIASLSSTNSTP